MNRRKSGKSRRIADDGFLRKAFTLWVLFCFILTGAPAYASRQDRLELKRADRGTRQERRVERALQRSLLPQRAAQIQSPQLSSIFQQTVISNRVGALEQPRLARKILATSRRELRQLNRQPISAASQLTGKTLQTLDSGKTKNVDGRLNLDLSSAKTNIILGENLFEGSSGSVTLTVGGAEKSYAAGSAVTAAEYASILQALNGGQTLVLDNKGRATAGALNFATLTASGDNLRLSELVIPEQVQAIGNFSKNSDVKLKGDLVNYGSIYAIANREGGNKATIATNNLTNQAGALISSVANASLGDDLASSVDLKLHADDTLSNFGRIESSGDLTLSAGSTIANGVSIKGNGGSTATVVAQNNLNLQAGIINNAGTMTATTGDINVTGSGGTMDSSIYFNSENGTVQALNGNINFRDESAFGKPDTTLMGGHWKSDRLNLFGGDGSVNANMQTVTGTVSVSAGTAHLAARAGDLTLGKLVTTGDPTIRAAGDVPITGDQITNGAPLSIIAGGNIIIDAGVTINTSGATSGGDLLMVAGADFEIQFDPGEQTWITGGTVNGGNMFVNGPGSISIVTDGGTGAAGNAQLIAFEAAAGGAGDIFFPTSSISAQGAASATNGNVTAIGRFVSIQSIDAQGAGSTASGTISLNSFQPVITGGSEVRVDFATGAIVSGGFGVGAIPTTVGDVTIGSVAANGDISVRASANVLATDAMVADAISLTSLGDALLDASWSATAPSGVAIVAGANILTTDITGPSTNQFISTQSATNAGDITIVAGAEFTETTTDITITGASSTGGFVFFSANPLDTVSAASTGAGTGGDITIAAFNGADAGSGDIVIGTALGIETGGVGAANGNVSVFAEAASGGSLTISDIDTTGGTAGTGSIILSTSTPNTSVDVVINKATGAVTSGNFAGGATSGGNLFAGSMDAGGDVTVTSGGDLFAGSINVGGDVTVTAGGSLSIFPVQGNLNTAFNATAGGQADLDTINVGSVSVAANGSILLFSDVTAPNGIAMVSGGFISAVNNGINLSTASSTANGGDIVLVAGALFNQDSSAITVTGGSATGGSIDFDGLNVASIDTSSSLVNGSGGDITMAAFFNDAFTGFIFTDVTTAITTGGSGVGANGNFTAIAGGWSDDTIGLIGSLDTTGGSAAGTGNVFIATATPDATSTVVIQRSNATLTNDFNGGAVQAANAFVGDITVNQANITITSGLASTIGDMVTAGGTIDVTTGSTLNMTGANAGTGNVVIVSGDTIIFTDDILARAGILMVSGRDIFANGPALLLSTSGSGNSGNISLIAGATFTETAGDVTITGASATGGQIDFAFNNASINTSSTGGGGSGGDITVAAFSGSDNSGRFLMDTTGITLTGGHGAGGNGDVVAVAGNDTFLGIQFGNLNTTGGAVNTGDITISNTTPVASPQVVFQKSDASTAGSFLGGAEQTSDVITGTLTAGGAISITGGDIALNGTSTGTSFSAVSQLDIRLSDDITASGGILLVAGRNIFPTAVNVVDLSTAVVVGNAGDITIIAGAAFTQDTTTVTITGASATGGFIDFDSNQLRTINATSTAAGGDGGDVTMIAFDGSDGTGFVFTDPANSIISTGGTGAGTNGTFTAIAEAAGGDGMGIRGTLNTSGGDANTGDVWIATATPNTTPNVVIQKTGANITTGDFRDAGAPLAASNIFVDIVNVDTGANVTLISGGNVTVDTVTGGAGSVLSIDSAGSTFLNTTNAGTVTIDAGTTVTVGSILQTATGSLTIDAGDTVSIGQITSGAVRLSSGNLLLLTNTTSATSFAATSVNNIVISGDITSPGGILLVSSHDIFTTAAGVDFNTSTSGDAGNISMIAGAAFNEDSTTVTITGASATGGQVDLDFNAVGTLNTTSTGGGGAGGDIMLVAFLGSDNTGRVLTGTTTTITTGGNGAGSNGDVVAVAGNDTFFGIQFGSVNTTGGAANTGDITISNTTPVASPQVVFQKSDASTAGSFLGGAEQTSDVITGALTAGGTISITGGDIALNGASTGTSFLAVSQLDIGLGGDITAAGGILLVARRNIEATVVGVDLSTFSSTGSAGNISIIAGADFTQTANDVTITGASTTGGYIDFDGGQLANIDSRSTAANGVGGDVTMIAFTGTDGTGFVFTDPVTSVIRTGGSGAGDNGSFTAIAQAAGGDGIGIRGVLNTTGGNANTGDVWIATATPDTTPDVVISKSNASITAGDFRDPAAPLAASNVFVDNITVAGNADITLRSGGDVVALALLGGAGSVLDINSTGTTSFTSTTMGTASIIAGADVFAGPILQGAAGVLSITAGGETQVDQIDSGTINLQTGTFLFLGGPIVSNTFFSAIAGSNVDIANDITAPGGILIVSGRNISTNSLGVDLSTASATADAGDITLVAGAAFNQDASTVTITGASTTGGFIDFDFVAAGNINSRSTAANGAGGDVTMVAFTGTDDTGFVITDPDTSNITTGGNGAGANGDFTAIGGATSGFGIGIRGTLDTTGGLAGTGDVSIATATPGTNVVLSKTTAEITSGTFLGGPLTAGAIFVDDVTVAAGATIDVQTNGFVVLENQTGGAGSALQVSAGTSVEVGAINVGNASILAGTFIQLNGNVTGGPGSTLQVSAGTSVQAGSVNVGSASILAGTFIQLDGNVLTPGGLLMVAGTDIFPSASIQIRTDNANGDAGDLTLVAGANFTQDATSVTITAASATGGRIDLDLNDVTALTASSSFAGGNGGNITLVSLFGSNNTGEIFTDSATVINAGGNGAGSNGTITMVSAKDNGDSGIFVNGSINLSGGAGAGAISLNTSALPGNVTVEKATGSITAGTVTGGALVNSSINSGALTVRGGIITARSGDEVVLGALDVSGNVTGPGGTININTAGAEALTLGGVGANSVASLNAAGGTTSGDGGAIVANASGAGGITIASALSAGATEGAGGDVSLTASAGDIAFNAGASTINTNAGTVSAIARSGGSITLVGNNITAGSNISLLANGASGGAGGTIGVTTNGGDITVGTGNGQFTAQATGPGGTISFTANGGGDITIANTGNLSTGTVNLASATGTLLINGTVTGTTAVNLSVTGANTISGSGQVAGGTLTINAGTGATTLNTNVASLTLATNGAVTITEFDDIILNPGTTGAGLLTLNATGDDITFGAGVLTANGGFVLTTSGAGTMSGPGILSSTGQLSINAGVGAVDLNTNVASLTTNTAGSVTINETSGIIVNNIVASSIDITAGTGIAHGTGVIAADTVNLSALNGDIGAAVNFIEINNGANPVNLTADATGDIYINVAGTGSLNWGTTAGDNIRLTSDVPVTTTGDITATNVLDITTNFLDYEDDTLTANIINIQSQPGSGLILDGGTNGGILFATTSTDITATSGNLEFFGVHDFFGPTTIRATSTPTASIIIDAGADVEGHDSLTVITTILIQDGLLTGNPLILQTPFFTIANSTGDVNLSGNIIFQGQDFAILSAGNINITGSLTIINLSNGAGDAGSLLMAAGYDFTPATVGQVEDATAYTLTPGSQSVTGGNINLAGANIDLSAITGDGGSLTAIATAGSTNAGLITIGDIDASANGGIGGNVLLIGEGGINVGAIDTSGTGGSGSVLLAVAVPDIAGGNIVVTNGVVSGAGSFQPTTASNGDISFTNINAPNATVTLTGALGPADTIDTANGIIADTLSVNIGQGTADLAPSTLAVLNVSGNGTVIIDNTTAIQIGTMTGPDLSLSVTAAGIITTPVGGINNIADLTLAGSAGAGQNAIVLNGPITTTTSLSLTANGGGNLTVGAANNLSSGTVSLTSATGTLVINGPVTGTTSVDLQVSGGNTIGGTGSVAGGLLTVTAGTGATTLNTNVASITLATNGNVTITESDDITINAGSVGAGLLNLDATGDNITIGPGVLTANGGFVLTTAGTGTMSGPGILASTGQLSITAGSGTVDLNTDVASLTTNTTGSVTINETSGIIVNNIVASSIDITAGTGIAHGTGVIAADTVNLSALNGDIGAAVNFIEINNGANPVNLTADATGDIYINVAGTGSLNWGTTTGDNITLTSDVPVTTTGDITATNVLDITTNFLDYEDDTLTADIINIQSQPGSGLILDGGSNGGTMVATTSIDITATFGDLEFFGVHDFFGPTTLTAIAAPGAEVIIHTGADVEGHDSLTVISSGLIQDGTITGNPLIIQNQFFTIANSQGDVNLTGDIIFQGQDFAILASGNINIAGTLTLIDLSDATGDSGSLLMVAGFDFIPATGGQVTAGNAFTLVTGNQSLSGGSINLAAADIDLSSGAGNGGSFTAIASAGSTNAGTITLGDIDTTATGGFGGDVTIIGEGGVSVGNISAGGTNGGGLVTLAVATPDIVGGNIIVTNGVVSGTGTFIPLTLTNGNMDFESINASLVDLFGAGTAANQINTTNGIVADMLTINVGLGTANLAPTTVANLNVLGNGTVVIDNTTNIQIDAVISAGGTLDLSVTANGVITTPIFDISNIGSITLEGSAGAGLDAIVLNGNISAATAITLIANGGADITIDNQTLTAAEVSLESTAGDVTLTSTGVINASVLTSIVAFDNFSIAGAINTQTLSLTSGDSILTGDITGNITAPAGTFLTSTAGGIGTALDRFVTTGAELLLSAAGDIFVQSTAAGVQVLDVAAGGQFNLLAVGPITVNDVFTGNGDITITQTGVGALTVAAGANILSTEGDIILNNLDLNKKTGKIFINDGANIKASGTTAGVGDVFIAFGPLPVPPYNDKKKAPKTVVVHETGAGRVFFGQKGILAKKQTNITLNALDRDLVFSLSGKLNKKAINLGSDVTITADPPWDEVPMRLIEERLSKNSLVETQSMFSAEKAATLPGLHPVTQPESVSLGTALLTDLGGTSRKATAQLLSAKSTATTFEGDALSAIFGDDGDNTSGLLDATLISDIVSPTNNGITRDATYNMIGGCALIAPAQDITVKTGHAHIKVAGGSVALVVSGSNGTSVYDLHDTRKNAVQLTAHGHTVSLSPGRHAMICAREQRSYADANLAELILHRNVSSTKTAHGGSLFSSEFAVNSAIDCVPVLRNLMASKDPASAKLAAKLTKTQAVILYLFQNQEEFQQHVKTQFTAMQN